VVVGATVAVVVVVGATVAVVVVIGPTVVDVEVGTTWSWWCRHRVRQGQDQAGRPHHLPPPRKQAVVDGHAMCDTEPVTEGTTWGVQVAPPSPEPKISPPPVVSTAVARVTQGPAGHARPGVRSRSGPRPELGGQPGAAPDLDGAGAQSGGAAQCRPSRQGVPEEPLSEAANPW